MPSWLCVLCSTEEFQFVSHAVYKTKCSLQSLPTFEEFSNKCMKKICISITRWHTVWLVIIKLNITDDITYMYVTMMIHTYFKLECIGKEISGTSSLNLSLFPDWRSN